MEELEVFETVQKLQGSQARNHRAIHMTGLRPYRNYKVLKQEVFIMDPKYV